jgi:hypothetical protein
MSEPEPVTKRRRWTVLASFDVNNTPDPDYDVAACDVLGDQLHDAVLGALENLAPAEIVAGTVALEQVSVTE